MYLAYECLRIDDDSLMMPKMHFEFVTNWLHLFWSGVRDQELQGLATNIFDSERTSWTGDLQKLSNDATRIGTTNSRTRFQKSINGTMTLWVGTQI